MDKNYYGVIMAGGVGSRFWPLSRKKLPKQFIDIFDNGETLFQQTFERLKKFCPEENIYVVTNEAYRDIVKEQAPQIADNNILGEPHARNTAPCVAYAAFKIAKTNPDGIMAVVPSDHLILDEDNFINTMKKGMEICKTNDYLLTLGIKPTRPDTGYGYIQFEEENELEGSFKVKTFTEKPNREMAEYFMASGEFLWNSGMFIWKAETIKNEMNKHLPEIHDTFNKGEKHYNTEGEKEYINKAYELCTIISIDYGIMEKSDLVYVIPTSFRWSDIGTWNALYDYSQKDEQMNVIKGDMVFARSTSNCIVNVPDKKLVALNNVSNLIVVESDGILLIADIEKEQEIRQVVNDIKIRYGEKYI